MASPPEDRRRHPENVFVLTKGGVAPAASFLKLIWRGNVFSRGGTNPQVQVLIHAHSWGIHPLLSLMHTYQFKEKQTTIPDLESPSLATLGIFPAAIAASGLVEF